MAEAVRVCMLGGFRVSVGDRIVEENRWGLKKAAALIKLLVLQPGHQLHREQVIDLLWPELDAEAAVNNLHRTLYSARRALDPRAPAAGSSHLRLRDEQLQLCPDCSLWVDVEAFEEAAATARRTRDPTAYQAAADLYAGELLPGDRYEAWVETRREGLRQTYLSLLLEMAGLYEEREEYGSAIEALQRMVTNEPTHEGAHAGLMRLHALRGKQDEALEQYERLREKLGEETRAPGVASQRLKEEILAGLLPPTSPSIEDPTVNARDGERRHNLPASRTSFVRRERELVDVKRALAMTRLLTLTGAGGCGKTRLALEIARESVGLYPDGVWLVELAPLSEGTLVPDAVAQALEVRERPDLPLTDTLVETIASRRMLLLLDNCEHLIDAVARLVDALLNSCEHLRVLATSREALGISGETNWSVPSLTVPDTDHLPTVQGLARYESVQLFIERARSRLPGFILTPENARSAAEVCRRLDGIPLAIELATARMGALSVEQIAARLEDSLGFLTTGSRTATPRHRTLKATLEWSYDLLSEQEQKLFEQLSVFAGGWTLEAAEMVGAGEGIEQGEVLDLLGRLVNKSLVAAEANGDGELRYRMLEPVRQYGRERLEASEELAQVRERHARYYLNLVEAAEPELIGVEQVAWLERLASEYANLRIALGWFLDEEGTDSENRPRMGLRLATSLGRFWSIRGASEGREWLEKGLAKCRTPSRSLRSRALREAGLIATYHLDPQAIPMLEEALDLCKESGDTTGQAISINYLAHTTGILANFGRVTTLREEAADLLEEPLEDRRAVAHLHLTLGMMAIIEQHYEQVVIRIEEALALFRETGDLRSCAQSLTIMGIAALGQGDIERAARAFEETLQLLWRLKDRIGTFYSLMGAAGVAAIRGHQARVACLSGAAESLRKAMGHPAQPLKQIHYDYESYIAASREAMGEAAFEAAYSKGQAMSPEQAIEYALSVDEAAPLTCSVPEPQPLLSPREKEIARLIARGLTNRRIAEELSISERTVTTHVGRILNKLEATSRAQVAAWIVEQRSFPKNDYPSQIT